jgi:crotonobetainyl-CoA:carnitine CoA-transferase CaiB-like acyl-CoA transferase
MNAVAGEALADVRVLELGGGIAGPYGARLLGDFGAEVVKVERPGSGDRLRVQPPLADPIDGVSRGVLFEYLNWGKRSVELDLSDGGSHQRLGDLVRWADIVLVSLSPARVRQFGLTADVLLGWNPSAVVTLVSNFGHSGPYRDWAATDLVFQAMGGVMQISGTAERDPIKPGLNQSLYCAGINAAYASLAGYLAARRFGAGVTIDLSIHEVVASQLVMNAPYYAFLGAIQGRRSSTQDPFSGEPIPAGDGFVSLQSTTLTPVAHFAALFGDERFSAPEFATEGSRTRHAAELGRLLAEHLATSNPRDVFEAAGARGLLAGFVQSADQLMTCPQMDARSVWRVDPGFTVGGTPIRLPARFVDMSATPIRSAASAPRIGADNGFSPKPRSAERGNGRAALTGDVTARGPLSGMLVVDLSTVFAVPYLGALLSDLGAEVVKVEAPAKLDQTRSSFGASFDNEPSGDYWNKASTFQVLNRGKCSLAMDLSTTAGRSTLRALVDKADVLLDNFTPRVMRKWDMTYGQLTETNPGLIMLSNTGYGSTGPWASFKAQGTTLEATMGLTSVTGYPDEGPAKAGQSYPDFLACWTGLLAILAAMNFRKRTGRGQWIDLGMYQLGATVIPEALIDWQANQQQPPRVGDRDTDALLSGLFDTAEPGRAVAVSVVSLGQVTSLTGLIAEVPDADAAVDEGLSTGLRERLAAWTRIRSTAEVCAALQSIGVAAGPMMNARDLFEDKHLLARGFYEWVDHGEIVGCRPLIGRPFIWTSAACEIAITGRAPQFAEHNEYVITKLAGLDHAAYHQLRATSVVTDAPVDPPAARPLPIDDMVRRGNLMMDPQYLRTLASIAPQACRPSSEPVAPDVH